ncbi:MAG TPA: response regulator [Planctomycetota bacterium]|nr:response regulator [Planctomycetota bacterium]
METNEQKERILVVDDEEPVLDLLDATLRDEYDVDCAKTAEEALERCRERQYPAIIIDIALPGELNGFELVDELHKLTPQSKLIMITGLALDDDAKRKALEVADALLTKPFDVEEIKALLKKDLRLEHLPHGT